MIANLSTMLVMLATIGSDGQLQPGMDGVVYSPQRAFRVPLEMTESDRKDISAVRLFVSEDQGANWVCHSDGSPETTAITFRSKRDGTFWFTLAYILKDGSQSPAEIRSVEPGLKVCVDTREPTLKLGAVKSQKGRRGVKWEVADENLDPMSLRLAIWRDAQSGWEPLELQNPEKAMVFFDDNRVRKIQCIAKDRAGNRVVEQLEVDGDQFSRQTMSAFVLDERKGNSPRMPAKDSLISRREDKGVRRMSFDQQDGANSQQVPSRPEPRRNSDFSMSAKPVDNSFPPPARMFDNGSPARSIDNGPSSRMNDNGSSARMNDNGPSSRTTEAAPVSSRNSNDGFYSKSNDLPTSNSRNNVPSTPPKYDDWSPSAAKSRMPITPAKPSNEKYPMFGTAPMLVQYELDRTGAGSPTRVELWGTRDQGRSWEKLADDPDQVPPIEARMRPGQDGIWGLKIVCSNSARSEMPQPGTEPDTYVEVDATAPVLRMREPVVDRGQVQLQWSAQDTHLGTAPIRILYATSPQGPWTTIADKIENTGEYLWNYQRTGAQGACYVRIEAKDEAGNVGYCESNREIMLQAATAPRGKVLGIQSQRSSQDTKPW